MALGDHLRADQHPRGGRLEAAQERARADRSRPRRAAGHVGVEAEDREACRRPSAAASSCCEALGARAVARHARRAAVAAARRRRLAVSAVVTGEHSPPARCSTSATSQSGQLQTRPQERQERKFDQPRRLSSTIALPRALRTSASACAVERVQAVASPRMSSISTARQRPAVDAARQAQAGQRARALRPRRGAAQQQQRAAALGALGGDVARVVAGVALVLVGGVVLLVDDDQAEVLDRREHGRARTDADPRLARAQAPPLVVALGRAQPRVQHRDGVAEALDEAPHDLRGQRDLRDEHDRAAPLLERDRGGAQVDLGLAGAGHAVQQPLRRARRVPRARRRREPSSTACCSAVSVGGSGLRAPTGRWCAAGDRAPLAPAQPARRPGRQHEAQRARDRRAVLGARSTRPAPPARPARRARARAAARAASPRRPRCVSASPTTTPSTSRRPNGTTSIEPTSTAPPRSSSGRR